MSFAVLYIEETRDDSTKDWHFCIFHTDEDKYVVYGYRYNYGNDFYKEMEFNDQASLVRFLRTACCVESSSMDITMYFVNESVEDNFDGIYNAYRYKNEIFGYDKHSFTEKSLTDMLNILKSMYIL